MFQAVKVFRVSKVCQVRVARLDPKACKVFLVRSGLSVRKAMEAQLVQVVQSGRVVLADLQALLELTETPETWVRRARQGRGEIPDLKVRRVTQARTDRTLRLSTRSPSATTQRTVFSSSRSVTGTR